MPDSEVQTDSNSDIRTRLESIKARLNEPEASDVELAQAASDLADLIDKEPNEAKTTFVKELDGLESVLRVMRGSEDNSVLRQTARAISALSVRGVVTEDVFKAGAINELTRLLRHKQGPEAGRVRGQAATALGSMMGNSVDAAARVTKSDTSDAIGDLLDKNGSDPYEAGEAAAALVNCFLSQVEGCSLDLTERFAKRVIDRLRSDITSLDLVPYGCCFLTNSLVGDDSYALSISFGTLDIIQKSYRLHMSAGNLRLNQFSLMAMEGVARRFESDPPTRQKALDSGMLRDLLEALKLSDPECLSRVLTCLSLFAQTGPSAEELSRTGIVDQLKILAFGTLYLTVRGKCLQLLVDVLTYDAASSSFPDIMAILEEFLAKAVVNMKDDSTPEFRQRQEETVSLLPDPLGSNVTRVAFLRVGGDSAFISCLNVLRSNPESRTSLAQALLHALNNFTTFREFSEPLVSAGVMPIMFDLMQKLKTNRVFLVRCFCNVLQCSPRARAELAGKEDVKAILQSLLEPDDAELVGEGTYIVGAVADDPSLHALLKEMDVCSKLVDLATSSPDAAASRYAFWGLSEMISNDEGPDETSALYATLDAQGLQRARPLLSTEASEQRDVMPVIKFFDAMAGKQVSIAQVDPELPGAIISCVRRSRDPELWNYALRALVNMCDGEAGRDIVAASDPKITFVRHAFEAPLSADSNVLCSACNMLTALSIDVACIPVIIDEGYIPLCVNGISCSDDWARWAATAVLVNVTGSGEKGSKLAIESGILQQVEQLLSSAIDKDVIQGCKLVRSLALQHQGTTLSEAGIVQTTVDIIRSSTSYRNRAWALQAMAKLWENNVDCQDALLDAGLVTAIQIQFQAETQACLPATDLTKGEPRQRINHEEATAGDSELVPPMKSDQSDEVPDAGTDPMQEDETEKDEGGDEDGDPDAAQEDGAGEDETNGEEEEDTEDNGESLTEEEKNSRLSGTRQALDLLKELIKSERGAHALVEERTFSPLATLFQHPDPDMAREVLRASYQAAVQGSTDIRGAILKDMLENLIRLHSHALYSSHAEAEKCIEELATDHALLPQLVEMLGDLLESEQTDEGLLATTLLVVDDLVGTPDETDFAANITEIIKARVPRKIAEVIKRSAGLVKSRAEQIYVDMERRCTPEQMAEIKLTSSS